jgi:hypothetical protein
MEEIVIEGEIKVEIRLRGEGIIEGRYSVIWYGFEVKISRGFIGRG